MPLGPQKFYNILDHHHDEVKNWTVVNWNLGNMCNYSCSYCPTSLHDGSYGWNDYNIIKKFIDTTMSHYASKKIYFEFTGGEVTLWKDFIKIVEYIKLSGHDVGFISNASRTFRWWDKNKNKFDHICLSFHAETADVDHFLKVVELMSSHVKTHVNIMMHYEQNKWNICQDLAEKVIHIKNISLALQPLIIDFGNILYDYNANQIEYIDKQWTNLASKIKYDKKFKLYRGSMEMIDTVNDLVEISSAHRFINNKTNNWYGWKCWAGLEQIVIGLDG